MFARKCFGRFIHQLQSPFTLGRAVVAQNVVEQFFPVDPLSPVNTKTMACLGCNFAFRWKLTEVFLPVVSLGACYLCAAFLLDDRWARWTTVTSVNFLQLAKEKQMLHLTYIQLKRTLTKPHFPLLSTTTLNDYAIKNLKITVSVEIERGCKQLKEIEWTYSKPIADWRCSFAISGANETGWAWGWWSLFLPCCGPCACR